MSNIIKEFKDEYSFLSNFYKSEILYENITYPTAEHAFQAAKTLNQYERKAIAACATPGQAKRMGRQVVLRKDWEKEKTNIMYEICTIKFQNTQLRDKLIGTKLMKLFEGNTWNDVYWGVQWLQDGSCFGHNKLGNVLMDIRAGL
jgi:ribA/ribD-fused uncharacterized protein